MKDYNLELREMEEKHKAERILLHKKYDIIKRFLAIGVSLDSVISPDSKQPVAVINKTKDPDFTLEKLGELHDLLYPHTVPVQMMKDGTLSITTKAEMQEKYKNSIVWDGKDRSTEHSKADDAVDLKYNGYVEVTNSEHVGSTLKVHLFLENVQVWIEVSPRLFSSLKMTAKAKFGQEHRITTSKDPWKYQYNGYTGSFTGLVVNRMYGGNEYLLAFDELQKNRTFQLLNSKLAK